MKRLFHINEFLLKQIISLSVSIFFCVASFAQVTATLKADSNHIEIGDWLHLKLVVKATDKNVKILFPVFAGDSINRMEIVKKQKIDTAAIASQPIYSQEIIVSAYDSGNYMLPPIPVLFMNPITQQVDTFLTDSFNVLVSTLDVDTAKPYMPIKAPLKVDYKVTEFLWWLVALIVLIIAAIVYYFVRKNYKEQLLQKGKRPRPKDPPPVWAMKELQKLDQEKIWQKDDVKKYYTRLTDILRLYLEYQFDYYAMEATTDEIQHRLQLLPIRQEASSKLIPTLQLADFVKFAKGLPTPDQNIKAMEDARDFIRLTKPQEETNIPKTN